MPKSKMVIPYYYLTNFAAHCGALGAKHGTSIGIGDWGLGTRDNRLCQGRQGQGGVLIPNFRLIHMKHSDFGLE